MAFYGSIENAWDKHHNCQIVIHWKEFTNGDIVPGLYCKDYGIWIQWLDVITANELISNGIEVVTTQPKKRNGHTWLDPKVLSI